MKRYMLRRILFSIFSLLVVIVVVMLLVYTLINRNVIFQTDDVWNKKSWNDRTVYEYQQYQKFGYLDFANYTIFLKNKYEPLYGDQYTKNADYKADKDAIQNAETWLTNPSVQEFIAQNTGVEDAAAYLAAHPGKAIEGNGWEIVYLAPQLTPRGKVKDGGTGYLLAIYEKSVFTRLWNYLGDLFTVETTNDVTDPNLKDRYVRVEKDPYSGFYAVVGSGTTHKYLLYFDSRFPFIHQNWLHLNLGTSFTKYRGQEITEVITQPTGDQVKVKTQFPAMLGSDEYTETAIDFHSLTYNYSTPTKYETERFPDQYTASSYRFGGLSMLENSFVIGIIATILAYLLGLPIGITMARHKDGLFDKIGNLYIIFIMAVPSLAYIFIFAVVGTGLFGLPYKFANAQVKILAYFLPTISLTLPHMGSLMKWMRRYMIDQMNSDYVKFARAEGFSEKEIYRKHISPNAMIYLVHGIPASILGCLTGAIITERVYAVPGVGNLLTTAINGHDNGIIVACTVFYTTLSIISVILGDLLLAKWDPRVSLSSSKGGGR
ncbi:MAG: ABC transporter permease [Clostridia bacterium]|nr:ABC transporter permease [Clostridia bacterium]